MRIVYVIDSLASKGGAERIITDKMNYLAEEFGFEVTVVTCYQNFAIQPNAYTLSGKVTQVNLNIPYYSQYHVRYPRRLWVKWALYRKLCRDLSLKVSLIDPDVLLGVGYFNADMVCRIPGKAIKIIESHEARTFTMSDKGLKRSLFSRLFMKFFRAQYFRRIERHADVVVTLTEGDAKEWNRAKRVEVIPDFSVLEVVQQSSCTQKRVLAVGRLEWQKGFDSLLDAWTIVSGRHPDWRLDIFGSGTLERELQEQIRIYGLQNVRITPFSSRIGEEYAHSSIFALSSRFEGFSLVILEAMRYGVPCVTFDCPYGPGEVVEDGICGFVVENGNVPLLAEKICMLIEHDDLRHNFSVAALERAKVFDVDTIMEQWRSLFYELAESAI